MMVKRLIAASVVLAALTFGAFAQAPAQAPQFAPRDENPEDFPAGPGRDATFYACTACHGFKLVAAQGMTRRHQLETVAGGAGVERVVAAGTGWKVLGILVARSELRRLSGRLGKSPERKRGQHKAGRYQAFHHHAISTAMRCIGLPP